MSDNPFKDSYLKVCRAKEHLAELERIATAWSAETEHGEQIAPGASPFSTRSTPAPKNVGAIVGDVVHNLRASLDLMAVALVGLKNGNTKSVYFPFAEDEASFPKRIRDKNFHRAGSQAEKLLLEFAPYSGGNKALRALHDLDVQDKHHSLVPHGVSVTTATMRAVIDEAGIRFVPADDLLSTVGAALTFPPDSVFAGEEIIPVLHQLVELTTSVLKAFEALGEVPGVNIDSAGVQGSPPKEGDEPSAGLSADT